MIGFRRVIKSLKKDLLGRIHVLLFEGGIFWRKGGRREREEGGGGGGGEKRVGEEEGIEWKKKRKWMAWERAQEGKGERRSWRGGGCTGAISLVFNLSEPPKRDVLFAPGFF